MEAAYSLCADKGYTQSQYKLLGKHQILHIDVGSGVIIALELSFYEVTLSHESLPPKATIVVTTKQLDQVADRPFDPKDLSEDLLLELAIDFVKIGESQLPTRFKDMLF